MHFSLLKGSKCSSFLVMTFVIIRYYNILPKKELLWSPWVGSFGVWAATSLARPGCGMSARDVEDQVPHLVV